MKLATIAMVLLLGCASDASGPTKALAPGSGGTSGDALSSTDPGNSGDPGPAEPALPTDSGATDVPDEPSDPGSAPTDPGGIDPGAATDPGPAPDPGPKPDTATDPPNVEPWTLVVLPDTQYYSRDFPWVFDAQTQWIADNHEAMGLKLVVHEGDITHNNTTAQWANARGSIDILVDAGVPFVLAPGNHDYGPSGNASKRETNLDLFFGAEDYDQTPVLMLYEEGSVANSAHVFDFGGHKFLVIAFEFAPRDDVVAWADEIAAAYPDHDLMIITHVYLYNDGTRYDWEKFGPSQSWSPYAYGLAGEAGGINDGEQLWQKLVRKHSGFILTLNGHVLGDGIGRLPSLGDAGNVVHQVLANYQKGVQPAQPEGGGGFLRLMRFEPDGKTITVTTYSPYLDEWLTDPENDFVLSLDPTDYDYLAGATVYPVFQLEDDPNNSTLVNCDPGPITSPGADIDATRLIDADGDQQALLTGCSLVQTAGCDNDNDDPADAHGPPNAPGTESGGGYVSLNGGTLSCGWTGGAAVEKDAGQVLEIHEIGSSVENYRFKLCVDPANTLSCTTVSAYGTGVQSIPVDLVFF